MAVPSSVGENMGGHKLEQITPHSTTWQASEHPSCKAGQVPQHRGQTQVLLRNTWLLL